MVSIFTEVVRLSRLNEEYLEAVEERRVQKVKKDIARAERAAWKKRIREEKLRTQEQPKLKPSKNYANSERSDNPNAVVVSSTKSLTPVNSPSKKSDKSKNESLPELLAEVDEEDEEKEEEEEPLPRPYSVPPELRLLPDERELAGMVGWMGLVQKSDEFW